MGELGIFSLKPVILTGVSGFLGPRLAYVLVVVRSYGRWSGALAHSPDPVRIWLSVF